MKRTKAYLLSILSVALLALIGCGGQWIRIAPTTTSSPIPGFVHTGQQSLANTRIQIYAMGSTGNGSLSTPLLPESLLSDSHGAFTVPSSLVCPSASTWVYITSSGDLTNSSVDSSSTGAVLIALLGQCQDLSNLHSIEINEVTTVASISPLAPFITSATSIGFSNADSDAFDQAAAVALQLASPVTGASPGSAVINGQVVPTPKLNALASIVSSCVPGPNPCDLFAYAKNNAGIAPNDTVEALVNIAQAPTRNVVPIFELSPRTSYFQPVISAPPADWSLRFDSVVNPPVFTPAPNSYTGPVNVTLAAPPSAQIFYTLDGSTPSLSSTRYTGPVGLLASTTIRSIAVSGQQSSAVVSGSYELVVLSVPRLVFLSEPPQVVAGVAFSPTVAFEDQNGVLLSGVNVPVNVRIGANPAHGVLSGTTTVTSVGGVATFSGLNMSTPGANYTLALSSANAGVESAPFDVVAPSSWINLVQASGVSQTAVSLENTAVVGRSTSSRLSLGLSGRIAVTSSLFSLPSCTGSAHCGSH